MLFATHFIFNFMLYSFCSYISPFLDKSTFSLDWLDQKGKAEWGKPFGELLLTPTYYNQQLCGEPKFMQSGFTVWSRLTCCPPGADSHQELSSMNETVQMVNAIAILFHWPQISQQNGALPTHAENT